MKIGIVGGGQLAQMLALAAIPLGIDVICLEKTKDCSASKAAPIILGNYEDEQQLAILANQVDVLTYESENVSVSALQSLLQSNIIKVPIYPSLEALRISQDRWHEKNFACELGIPTPSFKAIESLEDLVAAKQKIGLPMILKTRRFGYDGKGQILITESVDLQKTWQAMQQQPCIVEQKINFDRELSVIAVCDTQGTIAYYPLIENHHQHGILRTSFAPYAASQSLEDLAYDYVTRIIRRLHYVGVIAVELFQQGDVLFLNEMAPRVHNSGHWTIEGAITSQFENHIRAISALPLGSTKPSGYSAMINFIGELPDLKKLLIIPGLHYYNYSKQPSPQRKLGHATIVADNINILQIRITEIYS